jgi:hypothetical protein
MGGKRKKNGEKEGQNGSSRRNVVFQFAIKI